MCTFITAILPAEADRGALESRLHAHRLRLQPQANPGLARQLQAGEAAFLTTRGHCDCGTALGSACSRAGKSPGRPEDRAAADALKLRRKGWSEAKIARALSQRDDADVRDARVEAGRTAAGEGADTLGAEAWLQCLREVLASGDTPWIGLLHHVHDGSLDREFALQGRERWSMATLDADALARMREDVVHVIAR